MDVRRSGGCVIRSSAPHLFRIGNSTRVRVLGIADVGCTSPTGTVVSKGGEAADVKSKPGVWFATGGQIALSSCRSLGRNDFIQGR